MLPTHESLFLDIADDNVDTFIDYKSLGNIGKEMN